MMTEENTAPNEQVQEDVSTEQLPDDRDYKSLYIKEIQQHKKARARAQSAEEKNQIFVDETEAARKERLAQEGEYKTLLAESDKELSRLKALEKDHNALIKNMKQEILGKFSEEEQAQLSGLDLSALRLVDNKLSGPRPDNPTAKPGNVRTEQKFDLANMSAEDKRSNWDAIVESFKKN